jgi:hypothetical protein
MTEKVKSENYAIAFLMSIGAALLVAVLFTVISIYMEAEYNIVICLGASVVGTVPTFVIGRHKFGGAVIGFISSLACFILYQMFITMMGWEYTDTSAGYINIMFLVSGFVGGWLGYNGLGD